MTSEEQGGRNLLPRRRFLQAAAGLAIEAPGLVTSPGLVMAAGTSPEPRTAAAAGRNLFFELSRDETPIGRHEIRFARAAGRLDVDVRIDLEVELLFFTAFRYSHRNREVWQDGRLSAIRTETDDNGTDHSLVGRRTDDGLVVETGSGREILPAGLMPASWWHPETVGRQRLLNTQNGEVMTVRIAPGPLETIPGDGGTISARRYDCRGDLSLDLWRDLDDRLARIRFKAPADGSVIDYRRLAGA